MCRSRMLTTNKAKALLVYALDKLSDKQTTQIIETTQIIKVYFII
jgi:hypothetical protein